MKNTKKSISIIMTLGLLLTMSTTALASGGLIPDPTPTPLGGTESMVSQLLGIVKGAGIGVATGMLFYVGIKYTMASANEKADLKNSSIRYLIGALILFSLSTAFGIIQGMMNEVGGAL